MINIRPFQLREHLIIILNKDHSMDMGLRTWTMYAKGMDDIMLGGGALILI